MDAAGLIRHTGGIFQWMAAIVPSGERVSRRTLEAAPEATCALPAWYLGSLERTLAVLSAADPEAETWTFSTTGDRRVAWWCRRLAVEVALHRWDIQHAMAFDREAFNGSAPPQPLDGAVAAAGVEEFVTEFLPDLLAQDGARRLGEAEIVRMGLGTNRLTNTPRNIALVKEAVAARRGMIDTAHSYTGGQSEETIGAALSGDPDGYVLGAH